MAVVNELIRKEENGGISFGNYELEKKSKVSDYEIKGDLYKIKTFYEITRLERNDTVLYESVPGTAVHDLMIGDGVISFTVEGPKDAQITLGLGDGMSYQVEINGEDAGVIKATMSGKLAFGVELEETGSASVKVTEA